MSGCGALTRFRGYVRWDTTATLFHRTRSLVPREDTCRDAPGRGNTARGGTGRGDTAVPRGDATRGADCDQGNAEGAGNAEDGEVLDDRRALSSIQAD